MIAIKIDSNAHCAYGLIRQIMKPATVKFQFSISIIMTSITWEGPRYMQDLGDILAIEIWTVTCELSMLSTLSTTLHIFFIDIKFTK